MLISELFAPFVLTSGIALSTAFAIPTAEPIKFPVKNDAILPKISPPDCITLVLKSLT